jgi:transcriptional regulator with XRE-family HTH domain
MNTWTARDRRHYAIELGMRLRLQRLLRGLSMPAAAARAGLTHQALGTYERAERAVTLHVVATLASVYGVPIERLIPDGKTIPGEVAA